MEIQSGHTEIFCMNIDKSKDFYINVLGFEHIETQNDMFVWLKLKDNTILLRPGKSLNSPDEYSNSNIGFVFYTEDLLSAANELKSRGLVFKGTDGSDKCLTFTDPDGNWFQLVNPDDH